MDGGNDENKYLKSYITAIISLQSVLKLVELRLHKIKLYPKTYTYNRVYISVCYTIKLNKIHYY